MKSVVGMLGTGDFLRVRLGIRPEFPVRDLAAYVLAPMGKDVRVIADGMISRAADAVEVILAEGAGNAMSRFNHREEDEAANGAEQT